MEFERVRELRRAERLRVQERGASALPAWRPQEAGELSVRLSGRRRVAVTRARRCAEVRTGVSKTLPVVRGKHTILAGDRASCVWQRKRDHGKVGKLDFYEENRSEVPGKRSLELRERAWRSLSRLCLRSITARSAPWLD